VAGLPVHTGTLRHVTLKGLRRLLRFCAVGAAGFIVDAAFLYACASFLGWYGARVISFFAAATFTWVLNRRYTFTNLKTEAEVNNESPLPPPDSMGRQYGQYLLSMMLGGCVNYTVYVATVHWIQLPYTALIGVAFGSCAGLGINYVAASRVVFRHK
jgi:putative flippase GtrA